MRAPALRASLNPIAMACLRLVTFGPLLEPECSLPALYSRITVPTFAVPRLFAMMASLLAWKSVQSSGHERRRSLLETRGAKHGIILRHLGGLGLHA